jgi:hypothetical protein
MLLARNRGIVRDADIHGRRPSQRVLTGAQRIIVPPVGAFQANQPTDYRVDLS